MYGGLRGGTTPQWENDNASGEWVYYALGENDPRSKEKFLETQALPWRDTLGLKYFLYLFSTFIKIKDKL